MRAALESDYVSSNLHEWIDLIFGCKSRKDEAILANNLFYPLTYDYNVNLDSINVIKSFKQYYEKQGIVTQLLEYGQVPVQLFYSPHPSKIKKTKILKEKIDIIDSKSVEEIQVRNFKLVDENEKMKKELDWIKSSFIIEKEKIKSELEDIKLKNKAEKYRRESKKNSEKQNKEKNVKIEKEVPLICLEKRESQKKEGRYYFIIQ